MGEGSIHEIGWDSFERWLLPETRPRLLAPSLVTNVFDETRKHSPAVFDLHLTAAGIDVAVRATYSFRSFPTDLLAVIGRLAMFSRSTHHTLPVERQPLCSVDDVPVFDPIGESVWGLFYRLPAGEQFHFTGWWVDVAVRGTNGSIRNGVLAVGRARFLEGQCRVQTGTHVSQTDPTPNWIDPPRATPTDAACRKWDKYRSSAQASPTVPP